MSEVGSAFVSVLPSAKGFGHSLDRQTSSQIAASGKKSGAVWGKVFGAVAGLAIGAKAISFIGDSLAEAREAQKVGAQTEAVLKSTAHAAGINATAIGKMATRLSNFTGIDDEAIQSGENLLLTFTNIRNEVDGKFTGTFDAATGIMVDMSAALGQDMKSSAVQLGKALNDPIKGVTALSRVGVSFTEQQKEQIKTLVESGQATKAQQLILGELTKEFGGSAAAQATASDKARVAVGNLKEQIGTALLPVVDKMAKFVTEKVVPAISDFITGMQDGTGSGGQFADAAKKVWAGLQDLWDIGKKVVGFLIDNKEAVATFIGVLFGFSILRSIANGFLLLNAAMAANPIGLVVVTIALLAAGLVMAYKKSETFRNIVDGAFRVVGAAGKWLWNNALQPAFKFIINGLAMIIEGAADMLDALSHVPGFGWAAGAADKMHGAAEKAHELADGIKKIPDTVSVTVMVNTSAIAKAEAQLDRFTQNAANSFPHSPAKEGPLAAFNKFGGLGGALMASIEDGIKANTARTEKALDTMLDRLKGRLSTLTDSFKSVASSVATAFTPDVFGGTTADFINGLTTNVGNLKAVTAAFKILKKIPGLSGAFLSQLLASGNTDLILEMAANPGVAAQAAGLFDQQTSLSTSLGESVGMNQFGDKIDGVRDEIRELRKQLRQDGKDNADATERGAYRAIRDGLAGRASLVAAGRR